MDTSELIVRVLLAGALGALVGLDRELSDQPAGLRTHILVSLGAALFTMVGAYGLGDDRPDVDPTRIAAQVVTGIGFLGAGAIIRQGVTIRGLTTAAGLWVTAAIGTAVAIGFWVGAVTTTLVTVVSLYGFKRLERRILRNFKPGRFEFVLQAGGEVRISEVTEEIEPRGYKIDAVRSEPSESGGQSISMFIRLPPRVSAHEVAHMLESIEGVSAVDWSR